MFKVLWLHFFAIGSMVSWAQTDDRPNILLIIADDLGYADLGVTGSKQIKTPNIDLLAREGVFCSQGYVSSAVCSPSRAGLITGINQVTFGYDNNIGGNQPGFDPDYLGLPTVIKTIPDFLDSLGYVNGLVGKWHLGMEEHFHPLKRGFHEFWGYRGGGHDYFRATDTDRGYLAALESNYKKPQEITYLTDDKGNECVDFIKRHGKKPFFLYASFNAPHTPMQATEEDLKRYEFIKDEKRRTYAAMVHRLDVNVGKMMNALKEEGVYDNTLIVFISDNGGPQDSNASNNAPFRGQKGTLLEGGIRVPFIMTWKNGLPSGKIYHSFVSSLDLGATFLSLGGDDQVGTKGLDGVNLIPYLIGEYDEAPHEEMKWRFTISASIRKGNWKLIRLPDRLPMLYNLEQDVFESTDLREHYPEKAKGLLKSLGQWDVALPYPVFLEGAQWKARQLELYDKNYSKTPPE
ncbi:sulfatase-like hydrolase/transferase [Portibacter marinus]|uniref:sulfatase-like hydrolase/transferase n=1 Tax=Portibacter marinus TaxID=2898660 RepID=UPI001F34AB55|nr:sulfatase-like hydrolase/transferase [Portibacter marinus]